MEFMICPVFELGRSVALWEFRFHLEAICVLMYAINETGLTVWQQFFRRILT